MLHTTMNLLVPAAVQGWFPQSADPKHAKHCKVRHNPATMLGFNKPFAFSFAKALIITIKALPHAILDECKSSMPNGPEAWSKPSMLICVLHLPP